MGNRRKLGGLTITYKPKLLSLFLILCLVNIDFLIVPAVYAQSLNTPSIVAEITSPPIGFEETEDYIKLNFTTFNVEFYKDTYGYNKIFDNEDNVLVYDERVYLEFNDTGTWKPRGTPQTTSYVNISEYEYNFTRHYTDFLGTTWNVTYTIKSDSLIKSTISIHSGQTDHYRVVWSSSGITLQSNISRTNAVRFENGTENFIEFDWNDVYSEFGDITTNTVESVAQGRKLDVYFDIGIVSEGEYFVLDPSIIGETDNSLALGYSANSRSFYANGRYWVFYDDQDKMWCANSTDGATWYNSTILTGTSIFQFDIYFDETYFHYTHDAGGDLYYRRGLPNADGTITWSAVEQTVKTAEALETAELPSLTVDSAGYPWISYYREFSVPETGDPFVINSSTNDGTWTTATDLVMASVSSAGVYTKILEMNNGDMIVLWRSGDIFSREFNSSGWAGVEDSDHWVDTGLSYDAIAIGNDVHLVAYTFDGSDRVTYSNRTGNAWTGSYDTLKFDVSYIPVIASDETDLYVFWADDTNDRIDYISRNSSGLGWGVETTLAQSANVQVYMQSYDRELNDEIGVFWVNGSSSPYSIIADTLAVEADFTEYEEYVDVDTSNVDSVEDTGTLTGFSDVQSAPDETNSTLQESPYMEGGVLEDYVDGYATDVDSSANIGTHSNSANQEASDDSMDTLTEGATVGGDGSEYLAVSAFTALDAGWDDEIGSSPYIHTYEGGASGSYIHETSTGGEDEQWFQFTNTTKTGTLTVNLSFYVMTDDNNDFIDVWLDFKNGSGSILASTAYVGGTTGSWTWFNFSVGTAVTISEYDEMMMWLETANGGGGDDYYVDFCQAGVSGTGVTNYQLDIEEQFTTVHQDSDAYYLSVEMGTGDAEDILLQIWNSSESTWHTLFSDLTASAWNNISVGDESAFGTTVTVRFLGGTETGDASQSTWDKDALLIRAYNTTYQLEQEMQWTSTNSTRTNAEVCIKAGVMDAENLILQIWDKGESTWNQSLADLTGDTWNNVSVKSFLDDDDEVTIRFVDGTQSSDSVQGVWYLDSVLLHTWDVVAGGTLYQKAVDTMLAITDSVSRYIDVLRTITGNIYINTYTTKLLLAVRQATSKITLTTSITDVYVGIRQSTGGVAITDAVSRFFDAFRAQSDDVSLFGSATGLSDFIRTADSVVFITDFMDSLVTVMRTATSNILLNTSIDSIGDFVRTITDNVYLNTFTQKIMSIQKTLTDSISITTFTSRSSSFFAAVAGRVNITTSLSTLYDYIRGIDDAIIINTSVSDIGDYIRSITGNVYLTTFTSRVSSYIGGLTGGIQLSTSVADIFQAIREASGALTLNTAVSDIGSFIRSLQSNVYLTSFSKISYRLEQIITDSVNINTFTSYTKAVLVSVSDGLQINTSLTAFYQYIRGIGDDIILGSGVNGISRFIRSITDNININVFASRISSFYATITDNIQLTTSVSTLSQYIRTVTDKLTLNTAVTDIGDFVRALYDNIYVNTATSTSVSGISDFFRSIDGAVYLNTFSGITTRLQKTVTGVVNINTLTSYTKSLIKSLSDAVQINTSVASLYRYVRDVGDNLVLSTGVTSIGDFVRALYDNIYVNDATILQRIFVRVQSISITITDSLVTIPNYIREATSTIFINMTSGRTSFLSVAMGDIVNIGDSMQRMLSKIVTQTEAVFLSDYMDSISSRFLTLSDIVNIQDALMKQVDIVRTSYGNVNINTIAARIYTAVGTVSRTVTGVVTITDLTQPIATFITNLSSGVILNDASTAVSSFVRTLQDNIFINSLVDVINAFQRTITDSLSINTSVGVLGRYQRIVYDALDIRTSLSTTTQYLKTITDSLYINTVQTFVLTYTNIVTGVVNIGDGLDYALSTLRNISDAINITDSLSLTIARIRTLTGNVNLGTVITWSHSYARTITENVYINHYLTGLKGITNQFTVTAAVTINTLVSSLYTDVEVITGGGFGGALPIIFFGAITIGIVFIIMRIREVT